MKEELENKGDQFTIKNVFNPEINTKSLLLQYLGRTGLSKQVYLFILLFYLFFFSFLLQIPLVRMSVDGGAEHAAPNEDSARVEERKEKRKDKGVGRWIERLGDCR